MTKVIDSSPTIGRKTLTGKRVRMPSDITAQRFRKNSGVVDFSVIAKAFRFDDAFCELPGPLVAHLRELREAGTPYVCLRDKPVGRDWTKADGAVEPTYFPGPNRRGWHVLLGSNISLLTCTAKKSKSRLSAERQGDGWVLTLEVPVYDDQHPYRGTYWTVFHRVIRIGQEASV